MHQNTIHFSSKKITCPKCGAVDCIKDGYASGRQRYKCKKCYYRHTIEQKGFSNKVKRRALILYLHGLDYRSISLILQCSHVSVYNWIKPFHPEIKSLRSKTGIQTLKLSDFLMNINSNEPHPDMLIIELIEQDTPAIYLLNDKQ